MNLGLLLGIIGAAYGIFEHNRANQLKDENDYLKLTINNHRKLLADFDYINSYAKQLDFKGAPDFFQYLAEKHDKRFFPLADFLFYVRRIRNNVAHKGAIYNLSEDFFEKLSACVEICEYFKGLPKKKRLTLEQICSDDDDCDDCDYDDDDDYDCDCNDCDYYDDDDDCDCNDCDYDDDDDDCDCDDCDYDDDDDDCDCDDCDYDDDDDCDCDDCDYDDDDDDCDCDDCDYDDDDDDYDCDDWD